MKDYLKKKTAGFYLTVLATVLAVIGLVNYSAAENKLSIVFTLVAAAIIVELLLIIVSYKAGNKPVFNLASSISAVLMAIAAGVSCSSQLDAIGYVVAGLYSPDKITRFLVFAVLAIVSMLVYCIASFMNLGKQE